MSRFHNENSGTKHEVLTTAKSQSSTQTRTSTATMATKTSFLKTKDFKEIETENRTETSEPEIIVDPNIIPKKGNHDVKSPSYDSRAATGNQSLVHNLQKSLSITFCSYSLFLSTSKTFCVTHFIYTLTVRIRDRLSFCWPESDSGLISTHLNFKY